jgi:GT2 family glycosyltransferase
MLNWNHSAQVIRCVESLHSWSSLTPEVWIVDNASRDEEKKRLSEKIGQSNCIFNEINKGFAGGNNVAIQRILSGNSKYILLLNNDADISEASVLQLLGAFQADSRLGIVGPILHERRFDSNFVSVGGRNIAFHQRTRIIRRRHGDNANAMAHRLIYVAYVPGTVAVVNTDVVRKVGLLDEAYFFSGEMADLCFRMHRHGYRCAIHPAAEARHTEGTSADKKMRETLYAYYQLRNRFLFVRKFYRAYSWYFMPFWIFLGWLRIMIALAGFKTGHARALMLALADGINARFGNRNHLFPA